MIKTQYVKTQKISYAPNKFRMGLFKNASQEGKKVYFFSICQALVPNPSPPNPQSPQAQSQPSPTQFKPQFNPKGTGADNKIL